MKKNIVGLSLAVFVLGMTFTGCSNKDVQVANLKKQLQAKESVISTQEKQLQAKESVISTQEKTVNAKIAKIAILKKKLENKQTPVVKKSLLDSSLTPPNAKVGECYAKVLIPAEYATKTEKNLLTSSVEKLKVTTPVYKDVKRRILDKAESFKYIVTPATYKCVTNRIMVSPEKITYKIIPATFKKVEKKVLVSSAHKAWKKGKGPISKINNQTGEIMCLVEIPAKYKTVTTTVVDQPERTEKIVTPAVYKNIKAQVIDREASYKKIIIPATYKTVTIKELDTDATVSKEVTPETYQTIETRYVSKPEELKWKRILCQTNTTKDVVEKLQKALAKSNYNPGKIDGVYGASTQKALTAFQIDNDLPSGALTLESLDALGIK